MFSFQGCDYLILLGGRPAIATSSIKLIDCWQIFFGSHLQMEIVYNRCCHKNLLMKYMFFLASFHDNSYRPNDLSLHLFYMPQAEIQGMYNA
jgi:hypothetical protein